MRMRRKPWARPELEACEFFIEPASENKGKWHASFKVKQPLHIELGCGKGSFIAQAALKYPQINFLGVDIKSEVLAVGRRTIVKYFEEENKPINNILLTAQNIERIEQMLTSEDTAQRIYINFCNPWPRAKHKKRRLTFPKQLELYKMFLEPGGEIHFKTDDNPLFEESILYFEQSGFKVTQVSRDLHSSGFTENIVTEHEKMFTEQGLPIHRLVAVYTTE